MDKLSPGKHIPEYSHLLMITPHDRSSCRYCVCLCRLGVLFSPLLPAVQMMKLLLLFNIKKVCVVMFMCGGESVCVSDDVCVMFVYLMMCVCVGESNDELSGVWEALASLSDDHHLHHAVVFPIIPQCCCVCDIHHVDVSVKHTHTHTHTR